MFLSKAVLNELPSVFKDDKNLDYGEYVELVFSGIGKEEAFKRVFPERYRNAIKEAGNNEKLVNSKIWKHIGIIERTNVVKSAYEVAHQTWWTKFITKKQTLLENLYDIAVDANESTKDRINASRTALQYMPNMEQTLTVKIEDDSKNEWLNRLAERKRELFKLANDKDVVDVEVVSE